MIWTAKSLEESENGFRRNLINSITGFKSLALVGTLSDAGETNLAPFSQIIHVGASPPLIGILFRPHTVGRHTLENILQTRFFTINHVLEDFVVEAHHTSARWNQSEFTACGLEEEYFESFAAPFVRQSVLKMGCEFTEQLDVQSNGTQLIIGRIQLLVLPEDAVGSDGFVDLKKAGTITSAGLDAYYRAQKIARLSYAKPTHRPEVI